MTIEPRRMTDEELRAISLYYDDIPGTKKFDEGDELLMLLQHIAWLSARIAELSDALKRFVNDEDWCNCDGEYVCKLCAGNAALAAAGKGVKHE